MTNTIDRKSGWLGLEQLLTAAEVGRVLRCSEKVVGNLRRAGDLPGVRVGRTHHYAPEDVRAYIRANRQDQPTTGQGAAA